MYCKSRRKGLILIERINQTNLKMEFRDFYSSHSDKEAGVSAAEGTPAQQDKVKSIYDPLGVRPLINASGTVTIVGATRVLPEVQKAMDDATREYVHIFELMDGVGRRLAELTGAESGCITAGASAAVTAGTA